MKFQRPSRSKRVTTPDRRINLFLSSLLFVTLCLAAHVAYGQQPAAGKTFRLSNIEVKGLQRFNKEQAIAASGLQMGQRVDIATLDAAAQRLLDSGLFAKLSYRLHTQGDAATVTFEVEEGKGAGVPVVFDNFVWFTDEELANAVRRELPSFDGTAPESTGVINNITKALQRLLQEKKIQGEIDYTPSADPAGGHAKHVFSIKGANIKVCSLHFPGAAAIEESALVKKSKPLFENEYSREFASAFAFANLIPIYRERGHLRAVFRDPSANAEADSGSCKGASLNIPVEEGVSYLWDKAEWSGSTSFSAQELEAALGMKSKEVANGLKIDAGIQAVQKLYKTKGFLMARVLNEPAFEDADRRVSYRFNVTEGPQYKMGTLSITGLPEADASALTERWKLRPGEVYNESYYEDEFYKKVIKGYLEKAFSEGKLKTGPKPAAIEVSPKINRQSLTVDLTIEFKNITQ